MPTPTPARRPRVGCVTPCRPVDRPRRGGPRDRLVLVVVVCRHDVAEVGAHERLGQRLLQPGEEVVPRHGIAQRVLVVDVLHRGVQCLGILLGAHAHALAEQEADVGERHEERRRLGLVEHDAVADGLLDALDRDVEVAALALTQPLLGQPAELGGDLVVATVRRRQQPVQRRVTLGERRRVRFCGRVVRSGSRLVGGTQGQSHRGDEVVERVTGGLDLRREEQPRLLHESLEHEAFGRLEETDVATVLTQEGARHQRSFSKVAQRP